MEYRPGRESDFAHVETFVWQAIFPTFDVPGLTEAERSENDQVVEQASPRVKEALHEEGQLVWVAWDEKKRSLAGYLILDTRGNGPFRVEQMFVRRSDWGTGVATELMEIALDSLSQSRAYVLALRYYNQRAIAFFEKLDFVNTGESAGDFEIPRILLMREAQTPEIIEDEDDFEFPTEDDEPHFDPVYAELPDYQLAGEELSDEVHFDRETSSLDNEQIQAVEDFIAKAKRMRAEKKPAEEKPVRGGRHPEIEFEVDYGEEVPKSKAAKRVVPPAKESPGFEFAFDEEGIDPAPRAREAANEPNDTEENDRLDLKDIPDPVPEVTPAELRSELEDRLGERLTAYFGTDDLTSYLSLYRRAENFHQIRDANLHSLSQWINARPPGARLGGRKSRVLGELIEYFIVETASQIHGELFPQKLLRYQGAAWEKTNLFRMVMDYLDFKAVSESVYTDFVTIPPKVLKRASENYLQTSKDETLFFICDQSLFGSGKQGFAMTDAGIYWKNVLQPAGAATYTTIRDLRLNEDHLLIDGQYFDAGEQLNLQTALLLDKLRRLEPPK